MAKKLKKIFATGTDEVVQDFTINSWHVSQSVDALTAVEDYDISISGSLNVTGSVNIKELDTDAALTDFVVIDTSTGELKKRTGGSAGTNGSSGTSGSSGSSGTSGSSGSSGTSGISVVGPAGNSGSSGSSGTSGTSGASITGTDTQVLYFDGDDNPAGDSEFTWDDTNKTLRISSGDDGTSGKNNLILTNEIVNPEQSSDNGIRNLGNIVGRSPDNATGIIHSKIQFEPDANWVYASGDWSIAPASTVFYTSNENKPGVLNRSMLISGSGQIRFNQYTSGGPFSSTTPTYNLGVDDDGRVVQVSPNYKGSDYNVITADRIDYNSYTSTEFTGASSYQIDLDSTAGYNTAVPNANKILLQTTDKETSLRAKINIGSFTQEMNIITPVSQSRFIIGNNTSNNATYNIKSVSLLNDPTEGDYIDMFLEFVSKNGSTDFTISSPLSSLQFRSINNVSTSTIYPISNYYTRISLGNLSTENTIFGFWLDETFRSTLKTGDQLNVEVKWFSDASFGESGENISFIAFATQDGSTLRRRFLTRENGAGTEVFQVSNSDSSYGKTQVFIFQYFERDSTEYGLIPISSYDSFQQGVQLN